MDNSTIVAIATPVGRGGIGIIKLSGPASISIAKTIFRPASSGQGFSGATSASKKWGSNDGVQSHRLYYGYIFNPVDQKIVDEVLLAVMKAPRSYTKEDIVEINAHGGPAAVRAVLELVLSYGARIAEPGEFTKRAFLNGRIDLTQAEAVVDIINARSERLLLAAAAQVQGSFKRQMESIRNYLIARLTEAEAVIDFPDEIEDIIDVQSGADEFESNVNEPLRRLIRQYVEGNVFREGLKVAVVGRPNVGKSSLLNRLVQKDRAIVSSMPGTTRDTIEEMIQLSGIPIIIADTAGLHRTDDPLETLGIDKTLENVNGADLVLFMIEAVVALKDEDFDIFEKIQPKPVIIVINKIDLLNGNPLPKLPQAWADKACVRISALYDHGMEALKQQIIETIGGRNPIDMQETIIPTLRQKLLLESSLRTAETVVGEMKSAVPMELIAIHLRDVLGTLGEITGATVRVDILDHIFNQFCIGK
jgi:tRNA modification GTPase